MGHYYAATLKPSLAGLDPAQKAAAIGGYVADTGIAPDAALKTLPGLTATGDAEGRIAATRELVAVFDTDPTARNKVPPGLAAYAETLVDLADTYELAPDEAVKTADALFGDSTPGADRPNPALLQLVSAKNTGVQTDAAPDALPDTAAEDDNDVPPDAAPQQFRPDGRLGRISNEAAELARILEANKDRGSDESTNPRRSRRSGSFRETLEKAQISVEDRNNAINPKPVSDDAFIDDDELPPGFTEEELLSNEELDRLNGEQEPPKIKPEKPKKPEDTIDPKNQDTIRLREANEFFRQRRPVDTAGKPLRMPSDDTRFNPDGSVNGNMLDGDPEIDAVLIWGLENTGIDPKTGKLTYYGNIDGFRRDPKSGRWMKGTPHGKRKANERDTPDSLKCGLPPMIPLENPKSKKGRILWAKWAVEFKLWGDRCLKQLG